MTIFEWFVSVCDLWADACATLLRSSLCASAITRSESKQITLSLFCVFCLICVNLVIFCHFPIFGIFLNFVLFFRYQKGESLRFIFRKCPMSFLQCTLSWPCYTKNSSRRSSPTAKTCIMWKLWEFFSHLCHNTT